MSSGLFYFDTTEPVRPGDRIELTSALLRRKRSGTVVWIPDKTALELAGENKQPEDWLIKLDDGTFTGWLYHPEELQPNKRLRLIARSDDFEPVSNEELERLDNEEAARTGGLAGDLVGCLALIALVLVVLVVLLKVF